MQVNAPEGIQTVEVKSNRKYIQPLVTAGQEIEKWRQALNQTLAVHLEKRLDWPESEDGVYFTDKPGWDAYGALLLWAAHEEHPEFEVPAVPLADLSADPAFQLSSDEHVATRSLAGKVAWVAGATRGAGRGIAVQWGAAGAGLGIVAVRSPEVSPVPGSISREITVHREVFPVTGHNPLP